MGETSKFRDEVLWLIESFSDKGPVNQIEIIDIGCGDDPLLPFCDKFDLPVPYTRKTDVKTLTFTGDARIIDELIPKSKIYHVVYSSHLLEDFDRTETVDVLRRWTNLLEKDGLLILLLPDQQRYAEHCKRVGEAPNEHHKIPDFSLKYVRDCMLQVKNLQPFYSDAFFDNGGYNFIMVGRKK